MGVFPYPVQYFSCKAFEQTPEDLQKMLAYLAHVGAGAAGAVAGETGIPGLKIDFNDGVRLEVPKGAWHVRIGDHDSGLIFYDQDVSETVLISLEKYYIPWTIEVSYEGAPVFSHVFDLRGEKVRLIVNSDLLGDMQSFLPYIPYVRDYYGAKVYYWLSPAMHEVCRRLYPDISLQETRDEDTYATFYLSAAIDFPGAAPFDGRQIPMTQTGQMILRLPEEAPPVPWPKGARRIAEPYVCIGVQSSSVTKGWLYPDGWEEMTAYVKSLGYRVLCIDRERTAEGYGYRVTMPRGAEDFTGNRPLLERADMLSHAEFFIGLPSGLSWLARTAGCPVVMIGGFSLYWCEFPTPYRVYNPLVCGGCYNDVRLSWKDKICPRQKDAPERQFECSTKITPRMVTAAIDRLRQDLGVTG